MKTMSVIGRFVRMKNIVVFVLPSIASAYLAGNFIASIPHIILFSFIVAFGLALNNIFDAKFDPKIFPDNPLSQNEISRTHAVSMTVVLLFLSVLSILYVSKNIVMLTIFLVSLAIFIFYSCPPFRLKERAPFDMILHSAAGPISLSVGWLPVKPMDATLLGLCTISVIPGFVGEIEQEIRDHYVDLSNKFKTSVYFLGTDRSYKTTVLAEVAGMLLSAYFIYSGVFPIYLAGLPLAFIYGILLRSVNRTQKYIESFMTRAVYIKSLIIIGTYIWLANASL